MKPLFSSSGITFLESLAFTRTLFGFDFDGTLSRITPFASEARMSMRTEKLLRELSVIAPVAVISGRSLQDLGNRLNFRPQFLVGNHGVEGLDKGATAMIETEQLVRRWRLELQGELLGMEGVQGASLEDKNYSLAIHYRKCRSKKLAKSVVLNLVSTLLPKPRIILGKCVVNILPSGAPHKGVAMLELMNRLGVQSGFYIGDDDTDEDVFTLPDSRIFTVRVGAKRASSAQYYIKNQSELNRLLAYLLSFHRSRQVSNVRSS